MKPNDVLVYTADGPLTGEMVRILLESANIPVLLARESAGAVYGLTVGAMGEVKVYVPFDRADEALELIRTMDEAVTASDQSDVDDLLTTEDSSADCSDLFAHPGNFALVGIEQMDSYVTRCAAANLLAVDLCDG